MDVQDAMWYSEDEQVPASNQDITTASITANTSSSSSGNTPAVTANLVASQPPTRQLRLMNSEEAVGMPHQDQ